MISIVIPTFNRSSNLIKTVKSILSQQYKDVEIIIVDNGPSTDDTFDKIKTLYKGTRIRYIRTSLSGVTYGRNLGNSIAQGEIIIQMDDDVTLIDTQTLNLVKRIIENESIDILGVLELNSKEDAERVIQKQTAIGGNRKIRINSLLTNIGHISSFYNISTGFEKLINMPKGIYHVDSFRSCFMAYKSSVLMKLANWDINYIAVGSRMGIREETDFLLRAKRHGFRVCYTNITAIWHRAGMRDESLSQRQRGIQRDFYYASAHTYMAVRDLLEQRRYGIFFSWLLYQLFLGGTKNPGLAKAFRKGGLTSTLWNFGGFWYGFLFAITHKRRLNIDLNECLLSDEFLADGVIET